MLSKTDGLTQVQLAQKHPPSELTLAGLLYHLALVEEDWLEVRFCGLPDREPWAGVDWDNDPDWEFRAATDLDPDGCGVATAKPAREVGTSCPQRQVWISCRSRLSAMVGNSRCGGCYCTSSRKLAVTLGTPTSCAKRLTARSASSDGTTVGFRERAERQSAGVPSPGTSPSVGRPSATQCDCPRPQSDDVRAT